MINKNTIYEIENNFCTYDDISNLHEKYKKDSKKDDMIEWQKKQINECMHFKSKFLQTEIQNKNLIEQNKLLEVKISSLNELKMRWKIDIKIKMHLKI